MKYPEEILREKIAVLENERDNYKARLELFVEDMYEDLWKLRNEIEQKFADLIEVVEDARYA
jgi:hypothetical protein